MTSRTAAAVWSALADKASQPELAKTSPGFQKRLAEGQRAYGVPAEPTKSSDPL